MQDVVSISTLVAEITFIDEEGRKATSKVYRTRRGRYFIDHQIETGIDAEGKPEFDHWFETISFQELIDALLSEDVILDDQTLWFRMQKPTISSGVRRLTPAEIESLRQDKKQASQRLRELQAEEERKTVKKQPAESET
jgi:hypothetical protein